MQIVLDIENTVINNLNSCDFLQDNCDRISRFIKNNKPRFVHLFTWGWKEHDDILHSVVDCIYDRLGVDEEQRGIVYTKSDSVAYAIDRGWLKKEDREVQMKASKLNTPSPDFAWNWRKCSVFQNMKYSMPKELSKDLFTTKANRMTA